MTALEASGTDPQQRLMLEVAYEALENGEMSLPAFSLHLLKHPIYSRHSDPRYRRHPNKRVCRMFHKGL